jgi:hypothetical protein
MKDDREAKQNLDMKIWRKRKNKVICVDQQKGMEEIL